MLRRVENDQLIGRHVAWEVPGHDQRRNPTIAQGVFAQRRQLGLEDLADDSLVLGAFGSMAPPVVAEEGVSIQVLPDLPQVGLDSAGAPERRHGYLHVAPWAGA